MRIRPSLLILLPALLLFPPHARADRVHLAGGGALDGVVVERGEAGVRLVLDGGAQVHLAKAWIERVALDPAAPAAGVHIRPAREASDGLYVALTHYVHPSLSRVDLVSAVHIADAGYFAEVQRWLDAADLVLYEGISRDGGPPEPQAEDQENPVRRIQRMLGRMLDLSFQLDEVRYDRPHFVHADLTLKDLAAVSAEGAGDAPEAEESGPLAALGPMGKMLERAGPMLESLLAQQMENPAARRTLKRTLAQALMGADMDQTLAMLPAEARELILHRRNEVVVQRVAQLAPKNKGSIAIFYGAAHMSGIEKDLVERLGYRRGGARWLRAWDMRESGTVQPGSDAPAGPPDGEPQGAPAPPAGAAPR